MKFILLTILAISSTAFAQRSQTISADCLRMSISGICIEKAEFETLSGVTSNIQDQLDAKGDDLAIQGQITGIESAISNIDNTSDLNKPISTATQAALDDKANDAEVLHQTGDEEASGTKTFTGKLVTQSTSNGSIPCPSMTETERNAIASPVAGDCVFNSTTNSLNVYNGTLWKAAGGGLSAWETAFSYAVGDIVIESEKIYQALEAHTSGTFATDLASVKWKRLNNELTINSTTAKTLEVPYNQVTVTGTDKALIETGNSNRLINPGFEHSTIWTGWTTECTGTATIYMGGSSLKYEGKQVLEFEVIGGASGGQCTIYQNAETVAVDGVVAIAIHSENASGVKVLKKTNIYDTALEKDILGKSEWQKIELVGKLGSSETGVAIEVTVGASETKEVHLDEAKVAIANTKQVVGVDTDSNKYLWTPTVTGLGAGSGNAQGTAARVGDRLVGNIRFIKDATAGSGSAAVEFTLYPGLQADISKLPMGIAGTVGAANMSGISGGMNTWLNSPTKILLVTNGAGASGSQYLAGVSVNLEFSIPIQGWSATTEVYSIEADFFSTDTNTLTFKGTAITDSDPVGTFNTYSYAINSNTKTICATAPTQTIADMKTNGILIYTRAYNAASTCGNPARVEVKLGKGMKTVTPSIYKSAGKSISGSLDHFSFSADSQSYGAWINNYSETSGVYVLDTARGVGANTSHSILYEDGAFTTSGYLHIFAQPKKTTAVADLKEVVKSQGATGQVDIQSVYFGSGADCLTACSAGTCTICNQVGDKITSITWNAIGNYNLNGIDGTKYNCEGTGIGTSDNEPIVHNRVNSNSIRARVQGITDLRFASVTCIGTP